MPKVQAHSPPPNISKVPFHPTVISFLASPISQHWLPNGPHPGGGGACTCGMSSFLPPPQGHSRVFNSFKESFLPHHLYTLSKEVQLFFF